LTFSRTICFRQYGKPAQKILLVRICKVFRIITILNQACFAGFYIRIMLLSGSSFKRQLVPETFHLVPLALLGVLFSVGMQIALAFYLWTRLPPTFPAKDGNNASSQVYPGTANGRSYYNFPLGFAQVPLPANQYPNYKFANDVCRTVPIVQLATIGLFLFSILNNIPGVIKNFYIIWISDRFISIDEGSRSFTIGGRVGTCESQRTTLSSFFSICFRRRWSSQRYPQAYRGT
jgi:hypothetical protein